MGFTVAGQTAPLNCCCSSSNESTPPTWPSSKRINQGDQEPIKGWNAFLSLNLNLILLESDIMEESQNIWVDLVTKLRECSLWLWGNFLSFGSIVVTASLWGLWFSHCSIFPTPYVLFSYLCSCRMLYRNQLLKDKAFHSLGYWGNDRNKNLCTSFLSIRLGLFLQNL